MFETHDAIANQSSSTADSTSSILSGCAFDSMKQSAGCARPSFENEAPFENPITEIGPKVANGVADIIRNGTPEPEAIDQKVRMLDSFIKGTDPAERKLAQELDRAFLTGNVDEFAKVLQGASEDPRELVQAVQALNGRLEQLEGHDPEKTLDIKMLGRFAFIWPEQRGVSKAIQIDTKTGEVKAFPSVVTRYGEHINTGQELLNTNTAELFSSLARDERDTLTYPTRR